MELTKKQIQFIDYRLESEGVKYWDIRIEMLDHVVSDIEKKLKPENSKYEFNAMVQESLVSLGWKENFNGGGFDQVLKERLKLYNKNRNKIYFKYLKETLQSFKLILGVLSLMITLFLFQGNKQALKLFFFVMMGFYVAFMLRFAIKYKVMNSARMTSALMFATFPIAIFNLLVYIPDVFFEYKLGVYEISWIMILVVPFSAIGMSFINQELKKTQKIYNHLIS
jgi:hypothetical protein